jgi:RNA-directed DNA polymerase
VLDRLIQQAIAQILGPMFDPDFSASSFGFRPHCSAHGALRQVQAYVKAGFCIAVDLDLAKFFDNVDHDILMARVAAKVRDKKLLALIGAYLRAGAMVGEEFQPSELGTPQGGPLSPLLANILLDELDRELERRGAALCALCRRPGDPGQESTSRPAGQTQRNCLPRPAAQAAGQRAQEQGGRDR